MESKYICTHKRERERNFLKIAIKDLRKDQFIKGLFLLKISPQGFNGGKKAKTLKPEYSFDPKDRI